MSGYKIARLILFSIFIVVEAVFVYKYFEWERPDILNITSLTASVIAIIALIFNARQFSLNQDKRLYEIGEFRIEKVYKPKIGRISELKIGITTDVHVQSPNNKFLISSKTIHIVQHHLRGYIFSTYQPRVPHMLFTFQEKVEKGSEEFIQYLKALKLFYDGLYNSLPSIYSYHSQYLSIIEEVRKDKNIHKDQKESFIGQLLLDDLLGYNMIINDKATNNYNLVCELELGPTLKYETIGYLDFLKKHLPNKATYLDALGKEYKDLFEKHFPKHKNLPLERKK